MKECSKCQAVYSDPTLVYCLEDGTRLFAARDDEPTVVRTAVYSQAPTAVIDPSTRPAGAQGAARPASSGLVLKVVVALLGLGLLIVIVGALAAFMLINLGRDEPAAANMTSTPAAASPLVKSTGETDDLRDQIADLEKRLNAEQGKKSAVDVPVSRDPGPSVSARVNSPNDGFLALRTLPNSELGDRIYKIPHGATVSVGACGPVVTPVKRSGRWCQATYNGYSGWVFDGYLVY